MKLIHTLFQACSPLGEQQTYRVFGLREHTVHPRFCNDQGWIGHGLHDAPWTTAREVEDSLIVPNAQAGIRIAIGDLDHPAFESDVKAMLRCDVDMMILGIAEPHDLARYLDTQDRWIHKAADISPVVVLTATQLPQAVI